VFSFDMHIRNQENPMNIEKANRQFLNKYAMNNIEPALLS